MVSGFNHLHLNAGDVVFTEEQPAYIHSLTPEESEAFGSCLLNNKPIYLTLSANFQDEQREFSAIMNLDNTSEGKTYSVMMYTNSGLFIFSIFRQPFVGDSLMIIGTGEV